MVEHLPPVPAPAEEMRPSLYFPICGHVLACEADAADQGAVLGAHCPICAAEGRDRWVPPYREGHGFMVVPLGLVGGTPEWQVRRYGRVVGYVGTSSFGLFCWGHGGCTCRDVAAVAAVCTNKERTT